VRTWGDGVIRLRMSLADLQRMRFAYSPLAEVAESLHMINSGRIAVPHRAWFEMIRGSLRRVDMPLLQAEVPPRHRDDQARVAHEHQVRGYAISFEAVQDPAG
jgi:hypothetical protein